MKHEFTKYLVITGALAISVAQISQAQIATKSTDKLSVARAGTNSGGGFGDQDPALEWCDTTSEILDIALEMAMNADQRGKLIVARDILVRGIENALEKIPAGALDKTLTHKALQRALMLNAALEQAVADSSVGVQMQVLMLKRYYAFITKTISSLDTTFYIPYRYSRPGVDMELFERNYSVYAKEQISWLSSFMTVGHDSSGQEAAWPVYSDRGYNALAELIAKFASEDLSDSLFKARFACVIGKLRGLASMLHDHNLGNQEIFGDHRTASIRSHFKLKAASEEISQGCGR